MWLKRSCLLAVALMTASLSASADITYNVSRTVLDNFNNPGQLGYLTGTITTTGFLGIITQSDIVNWDLFLSTSTTNTLSTSATDTRSNRIPSVYVNRTALTASATNLDFASPVPAHCCSRRVFSQRPSTIVTKPVAVPA